MNAYRGENIGVAVPSGVWVGSGRAGVRDCLAAAVSVAYGSRGVGVAVCSSGRLVGVPVGSVRLVGVLEGGSVCGVVGLALGGADGLGVGERVAVGRR